MKLWEKVKVEEKGKEAIQAKTQANLQEKAVTITLQRVKVSKLRTRKGNMARAQAVTNLAIILIFIRMTNVSILTTQSNTYLTPSAYYTRYKGRARGLVLYGSGVI